MNNNSEKDPQEVQLKSVATRLCAGFRKNNPSCNYPSYVAAFFHPSGISSLESIMGVLSSIECLAKIGQSIDFATLVLVHRHIVQSPSGKFSDYLDTIDPSIEKSAGRQNDATYYYPACERSFPVSELHRLVFQGNSTKIKEYDAIIEKHQSWFNAIEQGAIPQEDLEKLFRIVRSSTHGTFRDFVDHWTALQSTCRVGEDLDNGYIHPILFAIKIHDLIVSYRPFVYGNRRLARLVLCHIMVKSGYMPPVFTSSPCYNAFVTRTIWIYRNCFLRAESARHQDIIKLKRTMRNDFVAFVLERSLEGEAHMTRTWQPLAHSPKENWSIALREGHYRDAILGFVSTRHRVIFPDIIRAMSIAMHTRGEDTVSSTNDKGLLFWGGLSPVLASTIQELIDSKDLLISYSTKSQHGKIQGTYNEMPVFDASFTEDKWLPVAIESAQKSSSSSSESVPDYQPSFIH